MFFSFIVHDSYGPDEQNGTSYYFSKKILLSGGYDMKNITNLL